MFQGLEYYLVFVTMNFFMGQRLKWKAPEGVVMCVRGTWNEKRGAACMAMCRGAAAPQVFLKMKIRILECPGMPPHLLQAFVLQIICSMPVFIAHSIHEFFHRFGIEENCIQQMLAV